MRKFGKFIAKNRVMVMIIAVLLVFPSIYGMNMTKVNYDMLTYVPKNYDSVKGQKILDEQFSNAANSMLIIEKMQWKDIVELKGKISMVDGVEKVIWVNDIINSDIPKEMLPGELKDTFYSKDSTMMIIKYKETASSVRTQNAIKDIRKLLNKQCFLSGASAVIKDTKDLADKETPIYVLLAVIFCAIVLGLTMESTFIPLIFLLEIFFAVMYNFGTNIFFGEISYVTKSLAAVLQLGVTMDYSIFLLQRYTEEKPKHEDKNDAMAEAIEKTFVSITGSSLTTIAGFAALCVMQLTIGRDIGIVMAKGVVIGVISVITILPALLLIFDKLIDKFHHKTILPSFSKLADLVTSKYKVFIALFLILFIPAIYGQKHVELYYNLDESLPKSLPSIVATNKLKEDYNMTTTHFILVNDNIPSYKVKEMCSKIENVDGITKVSSYDKFVGPAFPESFVPQDIKDMFKQGGYKLVLANSKYKSARDEENAQINEIRKIIKSYDKDGYLAGEGALTKDMIEVADKDFERVNYVSIIAIFVIILIVFKSLSIPALLVAAIELAILINMSIPFYLGHSIPFITSIILGCVQLGSTVDYAILLTSRYREELQNGRDKFDAMKISVSESAKSIVSSAFTFFASTAGVAIVS
ncbi:MAG TPA: antibiotic ABC transporter permease, partial [Clostridiaceae bacterium]|nr:antibiotic ABC transporter permease [Clostridiaceae bacterium]